jgi:Leucine Rich repeat
LLHACTQVIAAVAGVLPRLPSVESVNVSDNRLTDASLIPLCRTVVAMPALVRLNLSYNKVDAAAGIIRNYLADTRYY